MNNKLFTEIRKYEKEIELLTEIRFKKLVEKDELTLLVEHYSTRIKKCSEELHKLTSLVEQGEEKREEPRLVPETNRGNETNEGVQEIQE